MAKRVTSPIDADAHGQLQVREGLILILEIRANVIERQMSSLRCRESLAEAVEGVELIAGSDLSLRKVGQIENQQLREDSLDARVVILNQIAAEVGAKLHRMLAVDPAKVVFELILGYVASLCQRRRATEK